MPLVRRFGISPKPVSREFAREWQFNGLPTTRPGDFPERDFWPASMSRCPGIGRAALAATGHPLCGD